MSKSKGVGYAIQNTNYSMHYTHVKNTEGKHIVLENTARAFLCRRKAIFRSHLANYKPSSDSAA